MIVSLIAAALALSPLDCANPGSPAQTAICADPALRAADNSLKAAYNALLARTARDSQDALKMLYMGLEEARARCASESVRREACLRDKTDKALWSMTGSPFSGTGAGGQLTVDFMGRTATDRTAAWIVLLPQFADPKMPGERIVNRTIQRLFREPPFRTITTPARNERDIVGIMGHVAYAAPNFVSIELERREFAWEGSLKVQRFAINQVLGASVPTQFSTVIKPENARGLAELCRTKIDAQNRETLKGYPMAGMVNVSAKDIVPSVERLNQWIFAPDGVAIQIEPGQNLAPHICELGKAELRPYLKTPSTIWP